MDLDRRSLLSCGLPLLAVGLAGCTGDGGGDAATAGSQSPTDSPTRNPTDTATSTDSPTAADGTVTTSDTDSPTATDSETPDQPPTDPDQTVVVGPSGELVFEPKSFEVSTDATVLWVWDSAGHNVSPGSQPSGADWPGEDETTYGMDKTYAYTFEVAGTYEYHCDPHQSIGMVGSFTVTE